VTRKFRALLLAAGLGTRLRPLTNNIQKCLIPINGKPLLQIWLEDLNKAGCDAVIINTHYKQKQVEELISKLNYKNMDIVVVHEEKLLGTAGTLINNKDFFNGFKGLLIHADNFCQENIKNLLKAHDERESNSIITMLTFTSDQPSQVGIVKKDSKGVMTAFYEKSKEAKGNCANGAVYVFDNEFIELLKTDYFDSFDFSIEILPKLINRVQTFHTNKIYIDIGTPKSLAKAEYLAKKYNI